jgi:hypothetical protein
MAIFIMPLELGWINSYGFWGGRLFDFPNFFVCVVVVLFCGRLLRVSAIVQFILVLHCALPFFLNGVLFDYSYMPDQFEYWRSFNEIRSGEMGIFDALVGRNTEQAALFFSFMPFPAAVSPLSLGFFNSFLYVLVFYFLYSRRVFTSVSMWFFLLYPSMALYSALALRETLVFASMVLAFQFAREGRLVFVLISLVPLYLIKFQNFFILAPLLLFYLFFGIRRSGLSFRNGFFVLVFSGFFIFALSPIIIPIVNRFRVAMFVENGGSPFDVSLISSSFDFVLQGLFSASYFMLKPFPWEVGNAMQFVQSVENIFIFALVFLVTIKAWRLAPRMLVFWVLFFVFSMSIYGLVVANFGTAARYRYPFVVIYIVFVCAECQVRNIFPAMRRRDSKL